MSRRLARKEFSDQQVIKIKVKQSEKDRKDRDTIQWQQEGSNYCNDSCPCRNCVEMSKGFVKLKLSPSIFISLNFFSYFSLHASRDRQGLRGFFSVKSTN